MPSCSSSTRAADLSTGGPVHGTESVTSHRIGDHNRQECMLVDHGRRPMNAASWSAGVASLAGPIPANLRSQMLTCKHVIPHMVGRGGGAIVNMSSGAALSGDLTRTAYSVSKSGITT